MADFNFMPLPTTAPSFSATVTATGDVFRLETSSTVARVWGSPTNRYVRFASTTAVPMYFKFGTTAATDLATVGTTPLLVFPGEYIFPVLGSQPGMSAILSSTSAALNVTLGTMVQY